MRLTHLLPSLVALALLSACAGTPPFASASLAASKSSSIASAMAEADKALKLGQSEQAWMIMKAASSEFPADKRPWLRMAQLRFDSKNYGEAIVNALEAIERDPDDMLAHSIVAVSGLRVASKALGDLAQKNNLSGNVRTEAQDLARLMRSSLGEEVLVPGANKGAGHPAPPKKPTPGNAASKPASNSDPFSAIK
ncbi:MAG: hypothetical protein V4508_13385 [Pseudomonadota bacterium]